MGILRVLGRQAKEVAWDKGDTISENAARSAFAEFTRLGALAFSTVGGGIPERIREFDPNAQEIIISTQINGG